MNNMRDIIFKYIDNQLDEEEIIEFEKLLKSNQSLLKEVEEYRTLLIKLKKLNNEFIDTINPAYFQNILPTFRNKLEKKEKKFPFFKLSYAYTFALVTAVLLLLFSIPFFESSYDKQINIENFTFEELAKYYNSHYNDITKLTGALLNNDETILNYLVIEELYLNSFENQEYIIDMLYLPIDEVELEEIFNEMINKELL